jgi:hypothetical protein
MTILLTFATSHAALAAERDLLEAGLAVELIPVPRQIHSDCGFALLAEAPLERLRACAAQNLWRVAESQASPTSRKVKTYERIP